MNKKQLKVYNNLEDLYGFYNRFLSLEDNNGLLRMLVFKKAYDFINNRDEKIGFLEKEYLKLASTSELKVSDGITAVTDINGNILLFRFDEKQVTLKDEWYQFIGDSIFSLDEIDTDISKSYINSVLQNILVSKMYKTILSVIKYMGNEDLEVDFSIRYREELTFEDKISDEIKDKLNTLDRNKLARVSSR